MKKLTAITMLIMAASFAVPPLQAQPPQDVEWTEIYDQMFLKRTPLLGDYAPDVSAFDEKGQPFEFSDTQGKHTVVVFGCLT